MSRTRIAFVVLLFAALLVPAAPAQAASTVVCTGYSSCDSQGYPHAGYASAKNTSYWNMYTGTNCTNYVAYRLVTTNGMANKRPASGVGNARDWGTAMSSVTNSTPVVGAVAWWGKTGNHVAYIERVVSSSEIWVSESNWSGAFDWRKVTKSGGGWPDGIIHFADRSMANKTVPAISGTVRVGGAVTASTGTWSPAAEGYSFQWRADGVAIAGATGKDFTPAAAEQGKALTVAVTAARTSYPASTAVSPAVTVAPGALTPTVSPTISGTLRFGGTLTASSGTWSPTVTSFTYQWIVDGADVTGATATTFKPRAGDVGKTVSLRVRAAKTGYSAVFATSQPTAALGAAPVSVTAKPAVSGTAKVGQPLTASTGTWSRTELSFGYQWLVDGVPVTGATSSTFSPRSGDLGGTVSVDVTARRPGYATTTSRSVATAAVVRGTLTVRAKPTIAGTPRVGSRLSASTGSWSPSADVTYQWYRGAQAITGATDRTFVPTFRERGKTIRVKAVARRAGFVTSWSLSSTTAPVATGRIKISSTLSITGSPQVGTKLSVRPGDYSPAAASQRLQWLRDGVPISGATGRTHRVTSRDLGHRLSVRATLKATGYTPRITTSARLARVKSGSKLQVRTAKPAAGTVTFTIRVTAKHSAVGGSVTVRRGNGPARSAKVRGGVATITVKGQPAGAQTFRIAYNGTSTVAPTSLDKVVTVN